ncbi:competence protein ComEA helix-hairpin-helix repeat protein [Caldicellulosiruptor obsidiansis OB47]|uniref:Competence protein ComEA helix-hairpin-helix repeat protein n=1 Tax=Caldicellulosiruptor obsidiansis (strain ATCC BAA-2073 / JCM 16842 / OB47) TaxID=608506 RepID=D9TKR0_CALOO|nr:helix-hairpin-helix domain-containing protein [Caldicellulosiruptor obsidiansis]ADL42592.1 competence protein ComEA helix-hairpin-helix repeat protein [Caldicellulosiruptor obsidiansis OB47]
MSVFTKKEKVMIVIIAVLLMLNIYQYFTHNSFSNKSTGEVVTIEAQEGDNDIVKNESRKTAETNIQDSQQKYVVYVCGNVKNPGVYELLPGSRINDALILAGGALPGSDLNSINLAEKISDGQKIYIPKMGEVQSQSSLSSSTDGTAQETVSAGEGKININTATKEELKTLDRIGDKLAERIIEYRQNHGPFKSIEEIKNVNGIGEKIFESIKDFITVQ